MTVPTLPPFLQTSPPPSQPPTAARLSALYASTSQQRETNPTGYTSNSQWWASILEATLISGYINGDSGDRLVVRVDDTLLSRLEDGNGVRPKGIGGVIEGLATARPPTVLPLPTFMTSPTLINAPGSYTYRFVGKPLYWAFSQLNPFGGSSSVIEKEEVLWKKFGKGKEYVHMPLLEAAAAAFLAHVEENPVLNYTDSLYSTTSFLDTFSAVTFPSKGRKLPKGEHALSKRDCEVLIKWLGRDCGVLVTDGEVIKLLEPDQRAVDHPITEADRGTLSILQTLKRLEDQMIQVETQIAEAQRKVKHYLSLSNKPAATSHLRSKKALEDVLMRRMGAAEQLRGVIRSIDQAKGDIEVMQAYQTSTTTLRTLLSNPTLSRDNVDKTTDDLAEVLADQEEIDNAIRVGGAVAVGAAGVDVDEGELEKELEGLVEEEKRRVEEERAVKEKEERVKATKVQQERIRKEMAAEKETKAAHAEEGVRDRTLVHPSSGDTAKGAHRDEISDAERVEEAKRKEWERQYVLAQEHKREESQRAEAERMKRDEKRVVAE